MDPVKLTAVQNWPKPKKVKDIQQFLWILQLLPLFCARLFHIGTTTVQPHQERHTMGMDPFTRNCVYSIIAHTHFCTGLNPTRLRQTIHLDY